MIFKNTNNRVWGLDLMRAIAILLVVYVHGEGIFSEDLRSYYRAGRVVLLSGVSVFFVLSGFLIGGILLKIFEKGQVRISELGNFWLRRWFRTLPNYVFILTILVFLQNEFEFVDYFKHYIFAQNIF